MHTICCLGFLPGAQKVIVFIVDLRETDQQYESPRISAPKQLCPDTTGDGVSI